MVSNFYPNISELLLSGATKKFKINKKFNYQRKILQTQLEVNGNKTNKHIIISIMIESIKKIFFTICYLI